MSYTGILTGAAVIYGLVELVTLIQLPLIVLAVLRTKPPHRVPYIVLLTAVFFLLLAYPFQIALLAYEIGNSLPDFLSVMLCSSLFSIFADTLMFVSIMLLVIDRMKATASPAGDANATSKPTKAVQSLTILTYVVAGLVALFGIVWAGMENSTWKKPVDTNAELDALMAEFDRNLQVNRTFLALFLFSTLVIIISVIYLHQGLRKSKQSDKVATALLIAAPFLAMRALRVLITTIVYGVTPQADFAVVAIISAVIDGPTYALVIFLLVFPPILHREVKPEERTDTRWGVPGQQGPYYPQFGPPMQQWGTQPMQMQQGFMSAQPQFAYSVPQHPYAYPQYAQQAQPFLGHSVQYTQPLTQALPPAQQTPLQPTVASPPQSVPPDPTQSPASSAAVSPQAAVPKMSIADNASGGVSVSDDRARIEEENAALKKRIQELEALTKKA